MSLAQQRRAELAETKVYQTFFYVENVVECRVMPRFGRTWPRMEGLLSNRELRDFLLGFSAADESHHRAFRRRFGCRTSAYGSGSSSRSSPSALHAHTLARSLLAIVKSEGLSWWCSSGKRHVQQQQQQLINCSLVHH